MWRRRPRDPLKKTKKKIHTWSHVQRWPSPPTPLYLISSGIWIGVRPDARHVRDSVSSTDMGDVTGMRETTSLRAREGGADQPWWSRH